MKRWVKVVVSGRVQGVWFRAWTKETADTLGLYGQVRNLPDGTVEALIAGEKAVVEQMIEKFHQGSPMSNVTEVRVEDVEPQKPEPQEFTIAR